MFSRTTGNYSLGCNYQHVDSADLFRHLGLGIAKSRPSGTFADVQRRLFLEAAAPRQALTEWSLECMYFSPASHGVGRAAE